MKLHQAIVFCILMENDQGILGKSPDYVLEKLGSCSRMRFPENLLDPNNLRKFKKWQEKWRVKFEEEKDE